MEIKERSRIFISGKYGYDAVGMFHEGLARVLKDGKWGFIDKTGTEVISCNYYEVKMSHEG